MATDADRLTWYQDQHKLHERLELLYVVDGYELERLNDQDEVLGHWWGKTLAECVDAAMADSSPPKKGIEPDANCISTPDGGCIGGPCMHDAPKRGVDNG